MILCYLHFGVVTHHFKFRSSVSQRLDSGFIVFTHGATNLRNFSDILKAMPTGCPRKAPLSTPRRAVPAGTPTEVHLQYRSPISSSGDGRDPQGQRCSQSVIGTAHHWAVRIVGLADESWKRPPRPVRFGCCSSFSTCFAKYTFLNLFLDSAIYPTTCQTANRW